RVNDGRQDRRRRRRAPAHDQQNRHEKNPQVNVVTSKRANHSPFTPFSVESNRLRPVTCRQQRRNRGKGGLGASSPPISSIFRVHHVRLVHGFSAAAFRPAICPVHKASALLPPPLYIQPQNEPSSPPL